MKVTKPDFYFVLSLVFAIWFAFTSSVWTYGANVIISFPFLLLSYFLWRNGKARDTRTKRYAVIPYLWILGGIIAIVALFFYR
jgi:hypothetical protein